MEKYYDNDCVKNCPGLYIGTFSDSRDFVAWDHTYFIFGPKDEQTDIDENVLKFIRYMAQEYKNENPGLFNSNVSTIQLVKNGIRISGTRDSEDSAKAMCRFMLNMDTESTAKNALRWPMGFFPEANPADKFELAVKAIESAKQYVKELQDLIGDEQNIHKFYTSRPF